jgi:hypothetical protein
MSTGITIHTVLSALMYAGNAKTPAQIILKVLDNTIFYMIDFYMFNPNHHNEG